MNEATLCGRAGLAALLGVSESNTRLMEKRAEIAAVMRVGGRPLFSVADALILKAKRTAEQATGRGNGRAVSAPTNTAAAA
jgi:hypothetical protein